MNDQPPVTLPFDLTTTNTLHTLFASPQIKAHIGKFSGRMDSTFKTSEGNTRLFAFVRGKAPSNLKNACSCNGTASP